MRELQPGDRVRLVRTGEYAIVNAFIPARLGILPEDHVDVRLDATREEPEGEVRLVEAESVERVG